MKNPKKTLLIISVTDLHGRYLSRSSLHQTERTGGLDRLQSYLKEKQAQGAEFLLLDNGDSIQGEPLVDLYDFRDTLAHPVNLTHQRLGFDAFTLGNHEFNYGFNKLKQLQRESKIPWLAANIRHAADNSPAFEEYRIFEKAGMKIGLIGLITAFVPRWEHRTLIPGLLFEDVVLRAKKLIPLVRSQCDFLVLSYHGGFVKDPETGELWSHEGLENQAEALLASVSGVDLLITGHQHRSLTLAPQSGSTPWVVQASCYAKEWAEVKVTRPKEGGGPTILSPPRLVSAADYPADPDLSEALSVQAAQVSQQLQRRLGTADRSFQINDPMLEVWLKKHPMIQWVNQLIQRRTGAPIVCTSLLDSGLPGLPEEVRLKDILQNYFFMDHLCVIEVSGLVFREALEQVASFFAIQDHKDGSPKVTINSQWRGIRVRSYNYDIFDGINYTFDLAKPIGSRVVRLLFEGKEIQDPDLLQIGLTTYRAQGAFYQMFRPEQIIAEFPGKVTELMIEDLKKQKHLFVKPIQNFEVKVPR